MSNRKIIKALNIIIQQMNLSLDVKDNKIQLADKPKPEAGKWYVCIKEGIFGGYPDGDTHFFQGKRYYYDNEGLLDPISGFHEDFNTNGENIWDYFRPWVLKDAVPGDVLANDNHILILKELCYRWSLNGIPESLYAYCGIKPNGNFELEQEGCSFCGTLHIYPATKKQCNLLFLKMKEAGYEWDPENLKLTKIPFTSNTEYSTTLVYDKNWITDICIDDIVVEYRNSLPFNGELKTYGDALCHAYKQGLTNMLNIIKNKLKQT